MNSASTINTGAASSMRLAGALLLTILLVSLLGRLGNLETRVYDWFQQYQYLSGSDQIVVVTVDPDKSDAFDAWSADGFGLLVEKLNRFNPRVIAATQPLRLPDVPPAEQIQALAELERQASRSGETAGELKRLTAQLAGFRKNYDDQQALTRQLRKAGNVVLSLHPNDFGNTAPQLNTACVAHQVNEQGAAPGSLSGVKSAGNLLAPPPAVCNASRAIGFSADAANQRVIRLLVESNGTLLPSLPLAALAATSGNNQDIVVASANALTIADKVVNTGPGFEVLQRRYSNRDERPEFIAIAAEDVVNGNTDPELLDGRIVLIGNAEGASPASNLLRAATGLSNLMQDDYLLRPAWLSWLEYGMLAAIMLVVLLWLPGMPAVGAAMVGLVLATIVLSLQAWLLVSAHVWVQLGTASLCAAIAVWVASLMRGLLPAVASPGDAKNIRPVVNKVGGASDELDLQFSVLRQQPWNDDTKEKMYRIAFHHGRAEEFAKAERVLRYIFKHDPEYKDVARLLEKLSGQKQYVPPNRASEEQSSNKAARAGQRQKTLGRYTIERKIGEGALATVYLGKDPKIGRKVAIKTLALAEEFDDTKLAEARLQFMREAESAGRLNHPNIIAIYDVGEDRDVSYLAMEYFDSVSLLKHAQRDDLLPASWALELMARAAEALDYAHRQGVVHRDIKPANILYHATSDELKITDFGIARLTDTSRTKTGIILGTPSFMSPEQLMASGVTGQSDLYSLGVTLYQLLTGVAPFRADSIPKLMDKIMLEEPRAVTEIRPDLPDCVNSIIKTALAKKPEDRYGSGRSMAMALRECARGFGS